MSDDRWGTCVHCGDGTELGDDPAPDLCAMCQKVGAPSAYVIWERCRSCRREYQYPHLCRTHGLCGLCHPPVHPRS